MITDTITEEARDQIRQMQGEIERLTKQLVKFEEANTLAIREAAQHDSDTADLQARLASATAVLEAYEDWEGNMILTNKCWTGQNVTFTDDLWDRFLEIQTMRNKALGRFSKTDD